MYRQDGIQHTFLKLRESNSTGDFPLIMANVAHKALIKGFGRIPMPWKTYAKIGDLVDFKTHNRAWLGEFSDWIKKADDGADGYKEGKFFEKGYTITLGTYGRSFQMTRQMVINDDLGAFTDAPEKIGRAGSRTLGKQVAAVLETNPIAYDASPLFGTRNSVTNLSHTALTPDSAGIVALQVGMAAIHNAKDPDQGEKLGLTAKYLIVPTELEATANWLTTGTGLIGSTSAIANIPNPIRGLQVVVDPWLTRFPARWYLAADPQDAHFVEVGFLNGRMDPEVFVKASESRRVGGGGMDDFGYDYDDVQMKGRLDWAVAPAMYQAVFGGNQ